MMSRLFSSPILKQTYSSCQPSWRTKLIVALPALRAFVLSSAPSRVLIKYIPRGSRFPDEQGVHQLKSFEGRQNQDRPFICSELCQTSTYVATTVRMLWEA